MARIPQRLLFSWRDVEACSDLERLKLVLSSLPDEKLMQHLETQRGKGRNDYPIRPMWNALIAGIVFQHPSHASLLRELKRNAELRELCGFDPFRGADAVPSESAFSRFVKQVIKCTELIDEIFRFLVDKLGVVLPDFGEALACDSKGVRSFGNPVKDPNKKTKRDGRRDLDADIGIKKYQGVKGNGTVWERIVKWFGYKVHLIVDTKYELPVTYKVTRASRSDTAELGSMLKRLQQDCPEVVKRCQFLCADKGYDSKANIELLYKKYGIAPLIDIREMWKDGEETRPLFSDRTDQFVYDSQGTVYCICPLTGKRRRLSYCGFERSRQTLKYRCPAAVRNCECKGRSICESLSPGKVGVYGRIIRVPLSLDTRIFTPVPRHSYKWKRLYKQRTAVERVNSRLDTSFGFEYHTIRGMKKMKCRVGLSLVVMLAMALGRIKQNQMEDIRSLVSPVKRAA